MDKVAEFWAPRDCFVPVFPELEAALDHVGETADAVLAGDVERARDHLRRADVPLLRQVAMRAMGALDHDLHRLRRVQMPPKSEKAGMRMPGKAVTDQVFARDGWRCRFCGVRVVVPAARTALANAVPEALCWAGPTESLHAAFVYVSATLDHIVAVDAYYVDALHGDTGLAEAWHTRVPTRTLADWHTAQQAVDRRLIAWLLAADDAALDAPVRMPRGNGRVQTDAAAHMLQHLFSHQTHHRGQVHAMLSSTGVAPPQLDEFLMPSEPHLRRAEMAALGWDEAVVYGHQGGSPHAAS